MDTQQYHQPLQPVSLSAIWSLKEFKELCAAAKDTVDARDLTRVFGGRVEIRSEINTDLGVIVRHATFDPPLTATDLPIIKKLVDSYQKKLQSDRQPVRPPTTKKT